MTKYTFVPSATSPGWKNCLDIWGAVCIIGKYEKDDKAILEEK